MATPPQSDFSDAPHLSLAARRLLARSRQQDGLAHSSLIVKHRSIKHAWLLVTLPIVAMLIGVMSVAVWLTGTGQFRLPDFTLLQPWTRQVAATPTTQPTDAEFTALLRAEIRQQEAATGMNAPLRAPPHTEPPRPDAPALPATTPTPVVETKVRPLPWPYIPADSRPTRIYARHVGLDADIVPVGFSIRESNGVLFRIYDVARWAAGWHTNSSLPGWQGNTVLAGHQNAWGSVFRPALNLEPGDFLFVEAGGNTYSYLVVIKETLPETNQAERRANGQWIAQTEDERLTLVTCWPPDGNSHRVVIVAIPAK